MVSEEQHRSKHQAEHHKRNGRQGADLHNSGKLHAQKIQRDGGNDTGGKQEHDHPQPHPDALDMVMPAGTVFLTPLDGALLLFLLPGLLFHCGGHGRGEAGALKPLCKPRDAPHIGLDGGQLFPLFVQQMDGAVGGQPHGGHLSRRKLPPPAPAADVPHGVVLEYKQGAIASGQQHPHAQQHEWYPDQSTNKCRASVKRRCPSHDNGCQHHNKGKHPLDAPKHGDYFPFPYNDDWLLHFFRLFVSAEQ